MRFSPRAWAHYGPPALHPGSRPFRGRRHESEDLHRRRTCAAYHETEACCAAGLRTACGVTCRPRPRMTGAGPGVFLHPALAATLWPRSDPLSESRLPFCGIKITRLPEIGMSGLTSRDEKTWPGKRPGRRCRARNQWTQPPSSPLARCPGEPLPSRQGHRGCDVWTCCCWSRCAWPRCSTASAISP